LTGWILLDCKTGEPDDTVENHHAETPGDVGADADGVGDLQEPALAHDYGCGCDLKNDPTT
jgi:hypothetical protein